MDIFRKEVKTYFNCGFCGEDLVIVLDKTKLDAGSAYEVRINITIDPCPTCFTKATASTKLLREALDSLEWTETVKKKSR